MLVFSTQHCAPLPFCLVQLSPGQPPFHVWIIILYTRIKCVRGEGMGFRASDRETPAAKSLYRSILLDDNILHCLLWVLSFYGWKDPHTWFCAYIWKTFPRNMLYVLCSETTMFPFFFTFKVIVSRETISTVLNIACCKNALILFYSTEPVA